MSSQRHSGGQYVHLSAGDLLPLLHIGTLISLHSESKGKLSYEVEAEAAAAAAAKAAEEEAASREAALSGIPGADASWDEVSQLIQRARVDMDAGSMAEWLADGMLRAKFVDQMCGSWMRVAVTTAEQKRTVQAFWVDFNATCQQGNN